MGVVPRARLRLVKRRLAAAGTWLVLGLVLHLPPLWVVDARLADVLALSGEWCVAVALAAWLAQRWPHRQVGVRVALALAFTGLFTLEVVRTAGRSLTAADPQLYDLAFLANHVVVLVVDLFGVAALVGGLALLAGVLTAVTAAVFRLLKRVVAHPGAARDAVVASGVALCLGLLPGTFGARWVAPDWGRNVVDSVSTWQVTRQSLAVDPYAALRSHQAVDTPDIGLYVVESYGRVLDTTPPLHDPYHALLDDLAPDIEAAGLHVATGWATATVSGGRSWISDASVFLGIGIAHQSTWSHVQPHTQRFTHLPAWLEQQGYTTVVCRPKDRARLGVTIRNDFGWDRSVFADDLQYDGTLIGWGGIPDQYSLGWLHTRTLPEVTGPRFVFFHGVSAHGPWDTVPVLADDWEASTDQAVVDEPFEEMGTWNTVLRQARRYGDKLDKGVKLPGRMFPELRRTYFEAVSYSLRATVGSVAQLPDADGRILVIYGDHQPPFIARRDDYDVPVHILATDPRWLQPFLDHGFVPGMHGAPDAAAVPITALYPLLAQALVQQPLADIPMGISLSDVTR